MQVKLTQYSHGAGCGCKLSPEVLSTIVSPDGMEDLRVMVGNDQNDDAVAYDWEDGTAVISTTDFFTPIVDDAFDFGRIAAANALSDVYAMGGKPLVAIAILGWPIDKIPSAVAREVMEGARTVAKEAGISIAGGHSIDTLEPIFGLAVTGKVGILNLRRNSTAQSDDLIYLTKPLGVGIITTAQKKERAAPALVQEAVSQMTKLNSFGVVAAGEAYVHAMTDVTGFGLAGHLLEMCKGSRLSAEIRRDEIPRLEVQDFIAQGIAPGGTQRNWSSYGDQVQGCSPEDIALLADPQTSGGLLIAVDPDYRAAFETLADDAGLSISPIGKITPDPVSKISVD